MLSEAVLQKALALALSHVAKSGQVKIKTEPGLVKIKTEPGQVEVKTEPASDSDSDFCELVEEADIGVKGNGSAAADQVSWSWDAEPGLVHAILPHGS